MHEGKVLYEQDGIQVIDCTVCGLAHVNPLPTQAALDEFYTKTFYQDVKTAYFESYERDLDWWEMNYRELLNKYRELTGSPANKKLLDIGSGPGVFLKVAKEAGYDTLGVEPSEQAYNYSKEKFNCNVLNSTVEDLDGEKYKFDYIHNSLVLEHILEPVAFIEKAVSMLNPGGLFSVVVPNDFNPVQEINVKLGKKQWWVSPFEHLNYFNKKSLRGLFEKVGLEVVLETVTFPIDLFLLMGKDYLDDAAAGKEGHLMRKTFEFNMKKAGASALKERIYHAFSDLHMGRELIIIGRKA